MGTRPIDGDRLSFPVEFLGLFHTVKGTGIIGPDLDENRRPFFQSMVPIPENGAKGPVVDEVWFAGIHSDVGGGFVTNPGLGKISMRWVLDAAILAGLRVRYQRYRNR